MTLDDFNNKVNEFKVDAGKGRYHNPQDVCKVLEEIATKIEGLNQYEKQMLDDEAYDTGMLFWSM